MADLKHTPSSIVWESIPQEAALPDAATQHITFADLGYDFTPTGAVAAHIQSHQSTFLILDSMSIDVCRSLLDALPSGHTCVIINLWIGVTWVQNKHSLETKDYSIVGNLLPIYEPIDTAQLLHILAGEVSMYVRIPHDESADELFADDKTLYTQRDIDMTGFGYTGINGTIITQPSLLVLVTQALQYLKTTNGTGYDLFVHTWPREVYSESLQHSIQHTGKLVLIHDQAESETIRAREKACMQSSNIAGDITVYTKQPDYAKITTILPEYMYEQVGYTSETLAHYLLSLG